MFLIEEYEGEPPNLLVRNINKGTRTMNIIEALKAGRRIRRKNWHEGTWLGPLSMFSCEEILADNWEVEQQPVTITREQFDRAWEDANQDSWCSMERVKQRLVKELGL